MDSRSKRSSTRRVLLKDVATAAGVSLTSASHALNGAGSMGPSVRARILAAAEALGYRTNHNARSMRTGRIGAIGLIVPDFFNPFFTTLAQFVMSYAQGVEYCVFIASSQNTEALEQKAIRQMIDRGVDGLLWFPVRDVNSVEAEIKGVPTVLIDRGIDGFTSITADYASGGRMAAQHLLDLGHRRIGVISGPLDVGSMKARVKAAITQIEKAGALAFLASNGAYSISLDATVEEELIQSSATAIFAGTDLLALGVIEVLQRSGKHVPDDVSVIGFGDMSWCQLVTPTLSSVAVPLEVMAGQAVDTLLAAIAHQSLPDVGPQPVGLIQRASTKAVADTAGLSK